MTEILVCAGATALLFISNSVKLAVGAAVVGVVLLIVHAGDYMAMRHAATDTWGKQ